LGISRGFEVHCEGGCVPSVVALHPPHGVQMSEHAGDHTGDTCDALQEDVSNQILLLVHGELLAYRQRAFGIHVLSLLMLVSCGFVETPAHDLHGDEGGLVGPGLRFSVGNDDLVQLLFCVYWMMLVAVGRVGVEGRTWMRPCCMSFPDLLCRVLLEELLELGLAIR
jgi:hypothetical protein